MGSKMDGREMTKYTRRDCNLLSFLCTFQAILDGIELCIDDGNMKGAKLRLEKYKKRDCNSLNLAGMFATSLNAIEICLNNNNTEAAKHRIREMDKAIHKLKEKADAPTLQD